MKPYVTNVEKRTDAYMDSKFWDQDAKQLLELPDFYESSSIDAMVFNESYGQVYGLGSRGLGSDFIADGEVGTVELSHLLRI